MTMDMYPTFLEMAKAEPLKDLNLDGISILSHLLNNSALLERAVCWKIGDKRAIRKGAWKLCMVGDKLPELFDLSNDIGETKNLAKIKPELTKQLTAEYTNWEKDVTSNYK